MDLSCNETMINDVENEYNIYVEFRTDDEKSSTSSSATSVVGAQENNHHQAQLQMHSSSIAKLHSNACADPTFLNDRCLKNLLTSQVRYKTPSCNYFNTVQKTLTPQMRKIVAEWVIEVSEMLFYYLVVQKSGCHLFSNR